MLGEQGDDELTGSDTQNYLHGGPGSDKLTGGAGTANLALTERLTIDDKAGHWIVQPDQATCAPLVSEYPGQFRSVTSDSADSVDPSCGTPTVVTPFKPVDDAKGTKGKCEKSSTTGGAKRIVKSKYGVIFTKPKRFSTYACLYKGGRIFALRDEGGGLDGGNGEASKPVMNGRYVAYATRGSAIGDEIDRVVVWDMRNGFSKYLQVGPYIRKVVVKKNGSVAWISSTPVGSSAGYEVHRIQAEREDAGDETLVRASTLDTQSLKLGSDSNSITWIDGGKTNTAELR